MNSVLNAFARNRAEEMGEDLWRDFIVPLYFDKIPFGVQLKPLMIVGGRGCGKTTLLRYFCHRTQFSRHRPGSIDLASIGLYLRADTQFLRAFHGEEQSSADWARAFEHYLALALGVEILESIRSINSTPSRVADLGGHETASLPSLKAINADLPIEFNPLLQALKLSRLKLATWLNNSGSETRPTFFPCKDFLGALIGDLKAALPYLEQSNFFVFIDEYENLLPYQQEIINTMIKHSEPPLIFNIAMKKNGMKTRKTTGTESIQQPADYREINIEDEIASHNFPLFAAELFFFRLTQREFANPRSPISADRLRDPAQLPGRRDDNAYGARVLQEIRRVLPSLDGAALATHIVKDDVLRARLLKWIQAGLQRHPSQRVPQDFIREDIPIASVVCGALLHQERKRPDEIFAELEKRAAGLPSSFGEGEWEHHYFIGSVLYLYAPLQRPCPFYAGFKAFISLSGNNTRHFLELCHTALINQRTPKDLDTLVISLEAQALAARKTSAVFLDEIKGSGDFGNRLHTVVATLGQIFQLSQQRPSQSEPEKTHFSFPSEGLSDDQLNLLKETDKWSIFFHEDETKIKDLKFEQFEYVLNPIFAPYFGISYNKGRKLALSVAQGRTLLSGGNNELTRLIQDFKSSWFSDAGDQLLLLS